MEKQENTEKKKKMKPVRFYTVIWKDEVRKNYGVPKKDHGIILLEDNHGIKFNLSKKKIGRPKMRFATVYPLFETKEEADAYRDGNNDWETVEVMVLIYKS